MNITAFDIAARFIGTKEVPGTQDNPQILAMLKLDDEWPTGDEVPWCSAFANYCCWILRLPRSKSLRARSWLNVGRVVPLYEAREGDVVIFKRGKEPQPGPSVIEAQGHVGFYAGQDGSNIAVLGGNQGNQVKISYYPVDKLLGVRRLPDYGKHS